MAEIKLKAIPSPSNLPPEIQAFAGPVKEAIDVLLGRVGSGADAALTRRSAGKIVDGSTIINAGTPSSGGYIPDLTPPPAPTGLVATPGFSVINLEWNDSPYSAGHGHSHTVIYRSSDSLRGNAVQIGMTPGTIYVDAVGSSAGPFFYWIRYVTRDGVMGPWNSAEGVSGATAQDPEFLLDQLYGRIRESELTLALQNRISLVDGVGPGSVSARILAEAQARDAAIIAEANARQDADLSLATSVSGVSAGLSANSAAITQESQARATADGALASQISALASRTTSAEASIVDEQTARTSADSALSASISSVSSTVQGHTATITSQAESIDGLKARYTLQFDVNGRLSGWGAQAGQGGTEFTFLTDRFSIASPDLSGAASRPFVFQAADEVINGVTIPAGVYIDTAYMARFVARKGQIGSLAVDDASIANISAAKLTIGDGTIGGRLKSAYFASGVAGWQIHPDGTAEFNNVLVRGTVYAESGYFKGTLVGGAATAFSSGTGLWAGYHSGLYKMHVGNPTGAGFTWDGSAFTIRGADGSVLLASGSGVPYDKVSGVPTSLSEINSGEATKLAGIQAGATVGAAFGDNISGQISASNVSTYIAEAAIGVAQIDLVSANRLVVGAANIASAAVGLAQIDLASANKLVVGTANIADAAVGSLQLSGTIQSDNFVTGSAGWQIRKSDGWAEFQGVTVRGNVYDTRPYTVGNTVLIGHPTPFVPVLPNSSTPVKCKEIMAARTGTVRVYAEAFPGTNWTSAATHIMYVRKNGTTVTGGTTLWLGNNTDTTVKTTTVDVSVSPGDLISVWLQSQPLNGNGIQNMRLMAGSIYYESITY